MSGFGYNVLGFGANAAGGGAGLPSDDEFNRVSFLSHFDGANNGVNNVFDDGSASNHTITANGNVTQGSFGPFARPDGEWGVDFDGDDYLTVAASNDFDVSDGDITIEGFFNFTSTAVNSALWTLSIDNNDTNGIRFQRQTTGFLRFDVRSGGSYVVNVTDDTISLPLNTWHHVAVTRTSGGDWKVYVNGVIAISATESASSPDTSGIPLSIGANYRGTNTFLNGRVSNFRVVKGTLVYTSNNFTPPTGKLTAITNTKLLTCQSNRFVDNSASAHTVTPTGNPAATAFGPFLSSSVYSAGTNGASLGSDGSGDYLTIPQTTDMDLSGNFTVECWVYLNQVNKTQGFIGKWGGGQYGWILYVRSNGVFAWYGGNGGGLGTQLLSGVTATAGQWYHLAVCRTSSTVSYFVNGVRTATGSDSGNNTGSNTLTWIATDGTGTSSGSVNGYLSDVRVIKGTAAYNAATYTIPTAPLTAITNTKLLLNMADGQAIDSAAQNNLTLFGTAKTSTGQAKFGDASLLLDGNSDYAKTSGYVGSITGGKTIECWVYAASISSKMCIWEWYEDDNNLLRLFFEGGNGNVLRLDQRNGGSTIVGTTGATTLSASTWYHLAVTRTAAGAWKVYINGTADTDLSGSESGTTLDITDIPLYLGIDFWNTDRYWNGYIDDFRVSELDRYASGNFTAPSAAFPDKGQ